MQALRVAYSDLSAIAASLTADDAWHATGRPGVCVCDLLLGLLGDAQRGLVALSTPAAGPADRDAVSWWVDAAPAAVPYDLPAQRVIATAWGLTALVRQFTATGRAVVTVAGRTSADALVSAHDHVLRADDLVTTLVTGAAVHHLDLVADLPRPGPRREVLAVLRTVLDGLLGRPAPAEWPDERWALVGTGRVPPGGGERRALGAAVARLPLLG